MFSDLVGSTALSANRNLAAFGSIVRPRNHCLCCRARSNCLSGFKTGYCPQNFAAITENDAQFLQILIG